MKRTILIAAALAAAVATVPAGAVDDTKPEPCNGLAFKDAGNDQANTQVPEQFETPSTEMLGGFIKHDPAKGAEATTYNIQVADLKAEVPDTFTTISWVAYYQTPDETLRFVRTIHDFGGGTVFEYGSFTPNPTGVGLTGVSQYEGDTTGKLHEGPQGVVQMVIPAEHAPAGTKLETLYANSTQGRTLPGSVKSPNRGISPVMDTAPNEGGGTQTVTACEPAATPLDPVAPLPAPIADPAPAPPATTQRALPVTLLTKAVKRSRTLKLRLRSSERITSLSAQLRRGGKVLGRGKLAAIDGTATLRLKARKLRKGKHTLDLVGTDAEGKRLLTAATLKVR